MLIFKNAKEYVGSCSTLKEQISAIEAIRAALLLSAVDVVDNEGISQYSLNDGKTIIQTTYRNSESVMKSFDAWGVILNKLRNQKTGRMIRLVDKDTFNGSGCH